MLSGPCLWIGSPNDLQDPTQWQRIAETHVLPVLDMGSLKSRWQRLCLDSLRGLSPLLTVGLPRSPAWPPRCSSAESPCAVTWCALSTCSRSPWSLHWYSVESGMTLSYLVLFGSTVACSPSPWFFFLQFKLPIDIHELEILKGYSRNKWLIIFKLYPILSQDEARLCLV